MKHKKFVSAVVYVRNAEDGIEGFLRTIHGVFTNSFEKFEFVCVNDASLDGSKDRLRAFADSVPDCMVSVVNMGFFQGVEKSMLAGLDLAIGDFVFEFDSIIIDYEPDMVMECFERGIQGFDIVACGTGGGGAFSRLFYFLFNRHSGSQYDLRSETFRVLSRRAINRVHSMSPNPVYRKALYSNSGLRMEHLIYRPLLASASGKRNLKSPHDTAVTSLILFTNVAYKATLFLSLIMMLATFVAITYIVVVFFQGIAAPGWTTTMIVLSGAFFVHFAVMAVVIKYLSVLLELVFQRQRYVLDSIEKLT